MLCPLFCSKNHIRVHDFQKDWCPSSLEGQADLVCDMQDGILPPWKSAVPTKLYGRVRGFVGIPSFFEHSHPISNLQIYIYTYKCVYIYTYKCVYTFICIYIHKFVYIYINNTYKLKSISIFWISIHNFGRSFVWPENMEVDTTPYPMSSGASDFLLSVSSLAWQKTAKTSWSLNAGPCQKVCHFLL